MAVLSWGTSWLTSWATSWKEHAPLPPSNVIVVGGPPAAKKKRRVLVEIDGELFPVNSEREAADLLQQAKAHAVQAAVTPEPPKIKVQGKGELAQAVKAQVAEAQPDMEAIYMAAYKKWLDDDDADVEALLLGHFGTKH